MKEPQVQSEISRFNMIIADLEDGMAALEEKCEPVRGMKQPVSDKDATGETSLAPLAKSVFSLRRRVEEVVLRMRTLASELEI